MPLYDIICKCFFCPKNIKMSVLKIDNFEQTGGWSSLQITKLAEIVTMPDILTNTNAATTQIQAEDTTVDVLPVPESFNVTVNPQKTPAGIKYSIKIQIDFLYQSASVDDYFLDYINKDVVVVGVTSYNAQKLFGSKLYPLKFNYQLIDGKKLEQTPKTRITISGKIAQKPVFINC